jgi:hypothetical protein
MPFKKEPGHKLNVFIVILSLFVIVIAIFIISSRSEKVKFVTGNFNRPEYSFSLPTTFATFQSADSWEFTDGQENVTLQEIPNGKYDDNTILSLVPQFVHPPKNIKDLIVNGFKIITADYQIQDTSSPNFKLGDTTPTLPAFGYIVYLPKTKLFFFLSGKNIDQKFVIDQLIGSLKINPSN